MSEKKSAPHSEAWQSLLMESLLNAAGKFFEQPDRFPDRQSDGSYLPDLSGIRREDISP